MTRELASTALAVAVALAGCGGAAADSTLVDLLPGKARYAPGEPVKLSARVQGGALQPSTESVDLSVYHLDALVHTERKEVLVGSGGASDVDFVWTPPADDFTGYLAV